MPPVASTTAGAGAGSSHPRRSTHAHHPAPVDDQVGGEGEGDGHVVRAGDGAQRAHHLGAGGVAAGVQHAPARWCAPSRPSSRLPSRPGRSSTPSASRATAVRSRGRRALDRPGVVEAAAHRHGVRRVLFGGVVGRHRGGDAALRPGGGAVRRVALGHHRHPARRPARAAVRPPMPAPTTTASARGRRDGSARRDRHRPAPRPTASIARPPGGLAPSTSGSTSTSCSTSERLEDLGQGDPLHVGAQVAGPHELVLGEVDRHVVAHGALGHQQHPRRPARSDGATMPEVDPTKSAAASTSGGHSGCARTSRSAVGLAEAADLVAGEALVDDAVALPQDHLDVGLRGHVAPQVLVGQEDAPGGRPATRPPRRRWTRCSRCPTRPSPRPRC